MKNLRLFMLCFIFLYGNALSAQPNENVYKARCSQLDTSNIQTDFLADYTVPINNLYLLDGDVDDSISLHQFSRHTGKYFYISRFSSRLSGFFSEKKFFFPI